MRSRWLDIGQVLFCIFMDRNRVKVHKHAKKERGRYAAILTEQAWLIKDLLYGIKHQKMICVRVYFEGLKRKPGTCKNQWCVLLYPNWLNAEIQSFDWITSLTSKCLTSEWNKRMYKSARSKFETFFEPQKYLKMAYIFST